MIEATACQTDTTLIVGERKGIGGKDAGGTLTRETGTICMPVGEVQESIQMSW